MTKEKNQYQNLYQNLARENRTDPRYHLRDQKNDNKDQDSTAELGLSQKNLTLAKVELVNK